MRKLDPAEERKLIGAVEEAVRETKRGLSPNAAIQKVAEKYAFTPPFIEIITGAFNKSKSAYILKNAKAEEKIKPFELANADEIVSRIYGGKPRTDMEKVACSLPGIDFSKIDIQPFIEKSANRLETEKPLPKTKASAFTLYQKYASVKSLVERKMLSEIAAHRGNLDTALKTAASESRRLSDKQFTKVAQLVLNGYPKHGKKFVDLLCAMNGKDGMRLEKTAHAAVFPPQEPYLSIAKVFDLGEKLAKSENALRVFQKYAKDSFLQDMFANVAANGAGSLFGADTASQLGEVLTTKEKDKKFEEDLSPDFFNKLKEIDTRKSFLNLALYDPDLSKYEFPDLVKAYNNTVQMVPEAYKQEPVLKNMMLKNLESGGLKDTFELGAELDLNKKMLEPKIMAKKEERESAKTKAETKKLEKADKKEFKFDDKPGLFSRLLGGAGEAAEKIVGKDGKKPTTAKEERKDENAEKDLANTFLRALARQRNGFDNVRQQIQSNNLNWTVPQAIQAYATWTNEGQPTQGLTQEQQNVFDTISRNI